MGTRWWLLSVLLLVVALLAPGAAQATTPMDRQNLRGLPPLAVVFEDFGTDDASNTTVEAAGLHLQAVKAKTQEWLLEAGIPTVPAVVPRGPFVLVCVQAHALGGGKLVYSVLISVHEAASLVCAPGRLTSSCVWTDAALNGIGQPENVMATLHSLLTHLSEDWATVNGAPVKTPPSP
jgi:hypothetical protein